MPDIYRVNINADTDFHSLGGFKHLPDLHIFGLKHPNKDKEYIQCSGIPHMTTLYQPNYMGYVETVQLSILCTEKHNKHLVRVRKISRLGLPGSVAAAFCWKYPVLSHVHICLFMTYNTLKPFDQSSIVGLVFCELLINWQRDDLISSLLS